VELLAPADTWNAFTAAIGAGADAVYLGGKHFNMRVHKNDFNLTDEELKDAVIFAHDHGTDFDLIWNGEKVTTVNLSVPGIHNVYDALAAFATADYLGVPGEDICDSLYHFGGTHRRFETRGIMGGIMIVDDYAHHPTEIKATLSAARDMKYENVWCVFQPHTYTRTKTLFDDFVKVLTESGANIIITDIYAAREVDTGIVSAQELCNKIPNAVFKKTFEEAAAFIKAEAKRGDIVITMGAGNVYKIGDILLSDTE